MTNNETAPSPEFADFLLDFHGVTRQDILDFIAALEAFKDANS